MDQRAGRLTYAAFAGAVLIGGANFIGVAFSNLELPPVFGATLRFALASALFLAIGRATRVPSARGSAALRAALYGLCGFGFAYALLYYALVGLAAGTAAVVIAATPLVTIILAVLLGQERLTLRGVAGGVLAVIGIAVLSLDTLGGDLQGTYLVAAVLATVAIAASSVIARASRDVHPVAMNTIGMVTGTIFLGALSLLLGEPWSLPGRAETWIAVAWLVLFGSMGLFQLVLYVIRRWTASAATYAIAAMPVVAAALGALMLDQPVTTELLIGGSLVIAAVYIGAIAPAPAAAETPAPVVARTPGP